MAALAEQLAVARESVTGSSSHREEEFAQLKRECLLLSFLDNSSAAFFGFIHCNFSLQGKEIRIFEIARNFVGSTPILESTKRPLSSSWSKLTRRSPSTSIPSRS